MAGYLGAIPVPQATQHRESFTATSGQTTFNTAGYTVGFLDVYLNGSHLSPADFTATNGSDVVLASGASADDVCDIISYTAFEVANQTFTGTTTMDVAAITGSLNVDGTVTADGLTVDGDLSVSAANSRIRLYETDTTDLNTQLQNQAGDFNIARLDDDAGASTVQLNIDHATGNVSIPNGNLDVTGAITADGLTVDGAVVFNEASADVDFRVESNGNANMLFVDGGNNSVQVGSATPNLKFWHSSTLGPKFMTEQVGAPDAGNYVTMAAVRHDASAEGPQFAFAKSRATAAGGVTVAVANDSLGTITFQGADGTNYIEGARISSSVESGVGGNDMPADLRFFTNRGTTASAESMRLTSAGELLVGKTVADNTTVGARILNTGRMTLVASANDVLTLNRTTSDGEIVAFRKAGTTVGSIASVGGNIILASGSVGVGVGGDNLYPTNGSGASTDNVMDVGDASARFDDIFATNGTIQTSDANEKQDIAALTSAEMLVGKRISALFKTFRWKDKVAAKGDNARTHTGIIAQDVQSAFTAESLDAGDYSLFISSTWWEHDVDVPAVEAADAVDAVYREVTNSDGMVTNELVTSAKEAVEAVDAYTRTDTYDTQSEAPEGATSKTRMGIRYPELLSFVAAYNEQRFASIETRLTALEG